MSASIREMRRSYPVVTTIGFGGTQVFFTLFSGQAVIHLKSLGLSPSEIAVTLLSGPICGAVFQPYFGSWSDRCRLSWGRRRPFIVVGSAVLIVSILCLAWADSITPVLLSRDATRGDIQHFLVFFSIALTFTMFVAVQAVQVGLRALITDNCTPIQQARANTWAGRHSNLAGALAYLAAYLDLPRHLPGFGKTVFARTSVVTTVYLAISITITCLCTSEQNHKTSMRQATGRKGNFRILQRILFGPSNQIRTICVVQFFSWAAWFPFLFYTVTYVNSLQKHEATEDNNMGALAPLVHSTISLSVAALWPSQSFSKVASATSLTARNIWAASNFLFGIAMLGTFFITSALGTVLLFGSVGVGWAVTSRVPYSLLGDELSRPSSEWGEEDLSDRQGLIYGIHNLAICLPQIIMMSMMGIIWMSTGTKDSSLGVVWFLRLGGLFALIAVGFCTRLDERVEYEKTSEYTAIPLEEIDP
ncbi:MFS general substrate transporter [Thozetella sp. PMI_491]|nr:MFS general substrate transporter [Thozetella sp. PMI_491]